jgi:hypothetical protein
LYRPDLKNHRLFMMLYHRTSLPTVIDTVLAA